MNDSVICIEGRSDNKLSELALDIAIEKSKVGSKVIYYSLARSIEEINDMFNMPSDFYGMKIDDTAGMNVENIFNQLDALNKDKLYCVIDSFPLLGTKKECETRIKESEYIYSQICRYAKEHKVIFYLILPVSKYFAVGKTIDTDALSCYGDIKKFKNIIIDVTENIKNYMGDVVKLAYIELDNQRLNSQEALIKQNPNGVTINSDWNGTVNIICENGSQIEVSGSDYVSVFIRNNKMRLARNNHE